MNKSALLPLLTLVYSTILKAEDSLNEFESILNEASQIVTTKSANVDYMPSVVTVIDAQTYLDAGMQNVGQALGMLPGIQMQIGYLGQTITTIRGFKNPNSFISDKVKILIDGVAINNEASGTSGFYMDFPLDLVQRIEVLRGPGSTVYGAGAIYGSINIITKTGNQDKENNFYWGVGSYKNRTTGGNFNTTLGNYEIFSDAYYAQNEKSLYDEKALNGTGASTDEEKEDFSVGVKVVNGGFEFLTRYKSSQYGNFYARKGDLHPNHDRGHKDDYFLSQLSYKIDLQNYKLETKLDYSYRESDTTAYVTTNQEFIPEAFYIRDHQVEQNLEAQALLSLAQIYSNEIVIGVGIRQVEVTTNEMYSSYENYIASDPAYEAIFDLPLFWEDSTNTKIFGKSSRTISYANIQDLISLNSKTDFILGARVDYYSDIGALYSSRAGLVYRASDELIVKLLYGSAFRAPTFTERYTDQHIFYRYGDRNLKPETTNTYEAEIIYMPNIYNKFSLNVFYSTLSNVIDLDEIETVSGDPSTYPGYQNMKDRSSRGVEFEYYLNPQNEHNLYLNASYIQAEYTTPIDNDSPTEIDQDMPDISQYMFKAIYIYKPITSLSFGSAWQYYGQTTKTKLLWAVEDGRDAPVDAQSIFDETITYQFSKHSKLRFTVKNLFDTEVRVPSYYYTLDGGVLREGRNYSLNYKYTF